MSYKIKDFSRICGIADYNLRFYEKKGLRLGKRGENGYREYELEDSFCVNTFNLLQAEGFSIQESIDRVHGIEPGQYCAELDRNIKAFEKQKELLDAKLKWCRLMRCVYSELSERFGKVEEIEIPELYFFAGTKGYNQESSLLPSFDMASYVDYLPITMYAEMQNDNGSFSLGVAIPAADAEYFGIDTSSAEHIPAGKRRGVLVDMDDLSAIEQEFGIKISRFPVLRIYLMADIKGTKGYLHYLIF